MPLPLATYQGLCTHYYDLDKPLAPADAMAFYRHYAQKAHGAILEPMCGTGRFLIPLLKEGFPVEGFDASPFMLDALRQKCAAYKLNPYVWEGFLQDLNQPKKYDLIFIPCGSFCLMTDETDVKASLRSLFNHLDAEGIFLFEAETLRAASPSPGIWKGCVHKKSDGTSILLSKLTLPLKNCVETTICRYELIADHKVIHTEIEEFKIRLYEPEFLEKLLRETGFTHIQKIKAFDPGKKAETSDDVIIFECRK
jgi:hypothetical protein